MSETADLVSSLCLHMHASFPIVIGLGTEAFPQHLNAANTHYTLPRLFHELHLRNNTLLIIYIYFILK